MGQIESNLKTIHDSLVGNKFGLPVSRTIYRRLLPITVGVISVLAVGCGGSPTPDSGGDMFEFFQPTSSTPASKPPDLPRPKPINTSERREHREKVIKRFPELGKFSRKKGRK